MFLVTHIRTPAKQPQEVIVENLRRTERGQHMASGKIEVIIIIIIMIMYTLHITGDYLYVY